MKATGITRYVDDLGRIVIPKELRRTFDIVDGESAMEMFVEDDTIILKRYEPGCIFCGNMDGLKDFKGRYICGGCEKEISCRG